MVIKVFTCMLMLVIINWHALAQSEWNGKEGQPYYIIDDELTNLWIENLRSQTGSTTFKLQEKPIVNIHNSQIIDTIKIYKSGNSKIEFYKAGDKLILQSAIIVDPAIALDDAIKVGISKAMLSKALKEEIDYNLLRVGYLEGQQYFEFEFKNELLYTIKYCGIPD